MSGVLITKVVICLMFLLQKWQYVWCSYYKSGNISGVLITKVVICLVFLLKKWQYAVAQLT